MSKTPAPIKIQDSDRERVRAAAMGDKAAFAELVKRYQRRLFNFGLRMCGETRDAEDLVQETFLNAFKYLGGFRYETRFKNWLYRIAASICIKKRRKPKYAPENEISLDESAQYDPAQMPDRVPDWAQVPLDQLLDAELSRRLKRAVVALPEKYRLVVVLRDIEGFSTAETAQILDVSESNVKVRLHRARAYLRDTLKSYFDHAA